MLSPGVYRIMHVIMGGDEPVERHAARILVDGNDFHVLEDHYGLLDDSVSNGPMNPDHLKMLFNLIHSPYYKVINEDHINQGNHENLIPEMDIGPTHPDEEYILHGDGFEPQKVEVFGDNMCLNGQKLTPEELQDLMNKVRNGFLTLTPV